jgi:hypothetical protein
MITMITENAAPSRTPIFTFPIPEVLPLHENMSEPVSLLFTVPVVPVVDAGQPVPMMV